MIESLTIPVVSSKTDNEVDFKINYSDDIVYVYLDGKEIFRANYEDNFVELINRMREIW